MWRLSFDCVCLVGVLLFGCVVVRIDCGVLLLGLVVVVLGVGLGVFVGIACCVNYFKGWVVVWVCLGLRLVCCMFGIGLGCCVWNVVEVAFVIWLIGGSLVGVRVGFLFGLLLCLLW